MPLVPAKLVRYYFGDVGSDGHHHERASLLRRADALDGEQAPQRYLQLAAVLLMFR